MLVFIDEVFAAEWMSVPALAIIRQIVARASNRAFVGLPYCRCSFNTPYVVLKNF